MTALINMHSFFFIFNTLFVFYVSFILICRLHDHLLDFGVSSMLTPTTTTAPSLTTPLQKQQQKPPPPPTVVGMTAKPAVSAGGGTGVKPSTQNKPPDEHPVSFATGLDLIVVL